MIEARTFIDAALGHGYRWYTGVPCSFLTPFINEAIADERLHHVPAPNEGDAVALAAGLWLGGERCVVMMQNSGLGNAVSPLSSLVTVFGIPVLLIVTQRGAPGVADEPQHALMGRITTDLLDLLQVAWEPFPDTAPAIEPVLERAGRHFSGKPGAYCLVMGKGTVAEGASSPQSGPTVFKAVAPSGTFPDGSTLPTRREVLLSILDATPTDSTVLIATTGYTGRELFALGDRANHFYMVGSMGCASAFGAGLALARPDLHVVVVDGDGAALMRLGNFALVGHSACPNLTHVVLDNQVHESTGGQSTLSPRVDFASVAAGCGYARVSRAGTTAALRAFLASARSPSGPSFLHVRTRCGIPTDLPRPDVAPPIVLARLRRHLGGDS